MAVKKLTMVAQQAVGFAELFKAVFADGLQGPVNYRVEMSEPDGPSTGGGKLAMQHIKLVPADGGPTIIIGSANTVEKTAELRGFHFISNQHGQRFKGASLPIDPQKFGALIQSLQTFFTDRGMTVSVQDAAPVSAPMVEVRPATSPLPWVILGAALLALVGAAVFFLFIHKP